jgi:hypothetical protein
MMLRMNDETQASYIMQSGGARVYETLYEKPKRWNAEVVMK